MVDDFSTGTSTRDDGEKSLREKYISGGTEPTSSLRNYKIDPSSSSSRGSGGSSSSTATSSTPVSEDSLRTQYIEGSKPKTQPVSEMPKNVGTIDPTSTRIKIEQLSPGTAPATTPEKTTITMEAQVLPKELAPGVVRASTRQEREALRFGQASKEIFDFNTKPTSSTVPIFAFGASKRFIGGVVESVNPYELGKSVILTGAALKSGELKPKDIPSGIVESAKTDPFGFAGNMFGPAIAVKALGSGSKLLARAGKTEVPAETLFKADQIKAIEQGVEPTFPTRKSTQDIVKAFESTKEDGSLFAQTSSPSKLSGDEAALVGRGLEGTEGAGISVTPKGEGSAYFLGNKLYGGESKLTLNPLKAFAGVTDVPTVTVFKGTGVTKTPPRVTKQPGFEAENIFFKQEVAGSGQFVVPKRIQIGQGDIKAKPFELPSGKKSFEKGTIELEAKVPLGQQYVKTGQDQFTKIGGETVRVRQVELVVNKGGKLTTSSGKSITNADKFISEGQLAREASYLESYGKTSSKVTPGFPSVTTGSFSSLKISGSSTPSLSAGSFKPSPSSVNFRPTTSSVPDNVASTTPVSSDLRSYNISPSSSSGKSVSEPITLSSSTISSGSSRPKPVSFKTPVSSYKPQPTFKTDYKTTSFTTSSFTPRQREKKPTFSVEVRRKGEFQNIFTTKSKDIAFRVGAGEARGRAVASFRVKKEGRIIDPTRSFRGFTKSKREKGVLIEENKYRIDSPGEKGDITLLGIRSSKKKKKKKSLGFF